ncbi:RyR domain-containing protein [Butyrivibrio hungatei]|uniref:Ryanodine receptor Ryr domain-containing protein n=1 Tax=Butyrivibrio hungatei TaxID=185008 RepID=A0A1D9P0P1_9FIRM|nr:RyR domain-containing protein [Butyrivibrio hungatei]AOZ96167.1 hypothetical protein bhn_I1133 [Butyrivibrio hungatei]
MKMIKKILEKCPWLTYVAALIPYAVACYGYAITGEFTFWEVVYAAIAIYFVNPVSDVVNPYILFGEITSVIVTAGIILSVIRYAFVKLEYFFSRFSKDATVVYSDNELGENLAKTLKHGYVVRETDRPQKVKNHIVMLSDDTESISFYSRNESRLKDQYVYMMMNSLDSTLLKAADTSEADLHFFNVNDMMARDYWKKNNLYEHGKDTYFIAIIGYGDVGEAVFKYGYLNNIYSTEQNFEYHIWGCEGSKANFLKNLPTENGDRIVIHDEYWDKDMDVLAKMNRVIYTDTDKQIELIQKVLYVNPEAEIHCYSTDEISYEDIYDSEKILIFGDMKDILTEDNVKSEKLYRLGKLFNYDYSLRYSEREAPDDYEAEIEAEWKKLDGFKKSSSIARADHYWIEKRLKEDGIMDEDDEDALRIEHIRWSRFHYINHWTYAEKRDNTLRKHNMLVPYEKLSDSEKAKDGIYDSKVKAEIDALVGV